MTEPTLSFTVLLARRKAHRDEYSQLEIQALHSLKKIIRMIAECDRDIDELQSLIDDQAKHHV